VFLSFLLVTILATAQVEATEASVDRTLLFKHLQDTQRIQYDAASTPKEYAQIFNSLRGHFTTAFIRRWMREHVVKSGARYVAKPTDGTQLYVPRFTYSADTQIKNTNKGLVVYERFPDDDMYPAHYEAITLVYHQGVWKVHDWFSGNNIEGYLR
jgi:hypothetical protein